MPGKKFHLRFTKFRKIFPIHFSAKKIKYNRKLESECTFSIYMFDQQIVVTFPRSGNWNSGFDRNCQYVPGTKESQILPNKCVGTKFKLAPCFSHLSKYKTISEIHQNHTECSFQFFSGQIWCITICTRMPLLWCFSSESKAQIKTFFWIPFQRWILSLCIPWLGMKMQPRNICKPREYWNASLLAQSALNPWQKRSLKDEGTLRNMAEKTLWFWEKDLSESNFKNFDGAWK